MPFAKDITLFGINKTQGSFAVKIIDQYKNSKKSFIYNFVPTQTYCLAVYWIEVANPGKFQSIFFKKNKQKTMNIKILKRK